MLWARERLGLQGVGFGVLVTAYTLGGLFGTLLGGGLAAVLGITAPFLLGSGAVALLTLAAWPRLTPDALASPDGRP